jgi:hypothetical protein
MTWHATNGKRPRTGEKPLRVKFANGQESRWTYTARQLVFDQRGWDFDVVAVARADATPTQSAAWTPVSGGY